MGRAGRAHIAVFQAGPAYLIVLYRALVSLARLIPLA